MKYKGTYFNMWDTWYLNVNDTVHGFHLKAHSGENWNVGHIYTEDLLHFKKMRDVLEALPEEKYPDDCLGKYTGCAVEKDGIYYLYYTMRDRVSSEKIGLAISRDLENFTEYENNPVLCPDPDLFAVWEKGKKTNCRDMLIIYDEEREKYFGYFAAMANIEGRGELGVIGVAESSDLYKWRNQKIVYIPEFNGVVEVPNVFKINGKWYMTLMTNANYGAKGAVSDSNLNSYTIWASSDTPDGMFKCGEDNVFMGSSRVNNGYALRSIDYKGKLYAMYIERSVGGSAISLPKEIKEVNGVIRPYYTDILKAIRTQRKWNDFDFFRVPTAFAWENVVAGECTKTDEGTEITGYEKSFQAFSANIDSVKSLEAEFNISGDFEEAGLVIYCDSDKLEKIYEPENSTGGVVWKDCVWTANYISFNKKENYVEIRHGMAETICRRQFDFEDSDKIHVRVIVIEGQFEVYINDVLFIECGIETKSYMIPGIFAYSGTALISDFLVYEIED